MIVEDSIEYILNWNSSDNAVCSLRDHIENIRRSYPYLTVPQLVALIEEPFHPEYKEQVLKYYPDAIACDDVWLVLFPDGTIKDVGFEIKKHKEAFDNMVIAFGEIRNWMPNRPVSYLSASIETIRDVFPEIPVSRLVAMVDGPLFEHKFEAVVRQHYPEALAVDHVWFIMDAKGDIKDVEHELRAAGKI